MENKPEPTEEEILNLLAEVLKNQEAEGFLLTPAEIAEVARRVLDEHPAHRTWSRSWNILSAVAVVIGEPGLLAAGRRYDMFSTGVIIEAGHDLERAWARVEKALKGDERWFVRGVLELLEHGAPRSEMADEIRYCAIVVGVSRARAAGWRERLIDRLTDSPWTA
jgi:hypothetical protein